MEEDQAMLPRIILVDEESSQSSNEEITRNHYNSFGHLHQRKLSDIEEAEVTQNSSPLKDKRHGNVVAKLALEVEIQRRELDKRWGELMAVLTNTDNQMLKRDATQPALISASIEKHRSYRNSVTSLREQRPIKSSFGPISKSCKSLHHQRYSLREPSEHDLTYMIEHLRYQLQQTLKITQKDHQDKVLLISKIRELARDKRDLQTRLDSMTLHRQYTSINDRATSSESDEEAKVVSILPGLNNTKASYLLHPNDSHIQSFVTVSIQTDPKQSLVSLGTQSSLLGDELMNRQQYEYEGARLKENVTFWKEKVDMLLTEKKDALHEQMTLHKLIRDYEQQLEEMRGIIKEREAFIEQLQLERQGIIFTNQNQTMLEVKTDSDESLIVAVGGEGSHFMKPYLDHKDSTTSEVRNEQNISHQHSLSQGRIINISSGWLPPSAAVISNASDHNGVDSKTRLLFHAQTQSRVKLEQSEDEEGMVSNHSSKQEQTKQYRNYVPCELLNFQQLFRLLNSIFQKSRVFIFSPGYLLMDIALRLYQCFFNRGVSTEFCLISNGLILYLCRFWIRFFTPIWIVAKAKEQGTNSYVVRSQVCPISFIIKRWCQKQSEFSFKKWLQTHLRKDIDLKHNSCIYILKIFNTCKHSKSPALKSQEAPRT